MTESDDPLIALDRQLIWHPYASAHTSPIYAVKSASGCTITLNDGTKLIDGMASWWSAIHGYNHPTLNKAVTDQTRSMAHVMFGGLTHEPAVQLAKTLVQITPDKVSRVFFADSGSVAVEVALKMAVQFWMSQDQPQKTRFFSFRNGYHGDTLGAMSVCDPITGMHHLFSSILPKNIFIPAPPIGFDTPEDVDYVRQLETLFKHHHHEVAGFILEPILQGTGGMRVYSPQILQTVESLCKEYDVLLIADEIATGFGRTGELFACNHANINPDILCLGKALTGGYMTLAATLCSDEVSTGICAGEAGVFMHGPTFMANPLACAVANASIELLLASDWRSRIQTMEVLLTKALEKAKALPNVKTTRAFGGIGVIEMKTPVDISQIIPKFVERGVWLRPFGKLIYIMPPYVISKAQLLRITDAMIEVAASL